MANRVPASYFVSISYMCWASAARADSERRRPNREVARLKSGRRASRRPDVTCRFKTGGARRTRSHAPLKFVPFALTHYAESDGAATDEFANHRVARNKTRVRHLFRRKAHHRFQQRLHPLITDARIQKTDIVRKRFPSGKFLFPR